ncbi:NAD-dependent glucose-6-phosphate dehydrogenase Azf [Halobaculum sp. MBLA0147]|uniref:NAD-dependent glucose-6-phosphate dehydrogenase Azf n=1 Tax=Halobaculum sp. MBLA0147 TaxID=3079934 RepID=UPI00352592CB
MEDPVLLTGAGGRVGRAILDGIGDEYDWRLYDLEPPAPGTLPDGVSDDDVYVGDVTDREALREAVEGVGAVVHLAGDPRPNAPWDSVLANNVDGTHAVFETAAAAGVEKVAFASSNHAVGAYETDERTPELYRTDDDYRLDGTELPRPSNEYGVSKATGEVIGRYFHDHTDLSVVCVRIGNLTEDHPPVEYERGQAMWLSHRDCAHLFDRCLQAEYDFEIVYGISDNERKYYSIDRAREVLGYEPRDDSAAYTFDGEPLE